MSKQEIIENMKSEVCDKLCRFPFQLDQEELEDKCAEFPLEKFNEYIQEDENEK